MNRKEIKEKSQKKEPSKVLFILGPLVSDLVLATALCRAFKEVFPRSSLCVLSSSSCASLLENHAFIDSVLLVKRVGKRYSFFGSLGVIREIRSANFHSLLSFSSSFESSLVALFSGLPLRFGYKGGLLGSLAYQYHFYRKPELSESETLFSLFEMFLGRYAHVRPIKQFSHRPCMYVKSEETALVKNLLEETRAHRPILLAPSSRWLVKRWPLWYFSVLIGKLARQYQSKILLLASSEDRGVNAELMYYVKNFQPDWVQEQLEDISGRLSLQGLYVLLGLSSLLISNASTPLYLAYAAGTPMLGIFGPVKPLADHPALRAPSLAVQKDLACRPCHYHRHSKCPEKHFRCMKELSPLEALSGVRRILG